MEAQIMFWVQFGITVIGLIFISYQTYIQKSRLKAQTGIIEDLRAWKEMIDIDTMKKWMALKEEKISLQSEKEKKELESVLRREVEETNKQLSSTKEEFNTKLAQLVDIEQKLGATQTELENVRKDLETSQQDSKEYFDYSYEFLALSLRLTVTYIEKEYWEEFINTQIKTVYVDLFREGLKTYGEKHYEILKRKKEGYN